LGARRGPGRGSAFAVALPPVAPLALGLLALRPGGVGGRAEVLAATEADQRPAGLGADVGAVVVEQVDQLAGQGGVLVGDDADRRPADLLLVVLEPGLHGGGGLACQVLVEQFAAELLGVAVVTAGGDRQAFEDFLALAPFELLEDRVQPGAALGA